MESPSQSFHDKRFILTMLEIYGKAGLARAEEAERLIVQALQLQEDSRAMFDRANQLAVEYAEQEEPVSGLPEDESLIPF